MSNEMVHYQTYADMDDRRLKAERALEASQASEVKLAAKLHAAEEREAGLRKALEEIRDHSDKESWEHGEAAEALTSSPDGRLAKLEAVAEAAKGEHGCTYDKSSCPICQALSNLAGEG